MGVREINVSRNEDKSIRSVQIVDAGGEVEIYRLIGGEKYSHSTTTRAFGRNVTVEDKNAYNEKDVLGAVKQTLTSANKNAKTTINGEDKTHEDFGVELGILKGRLKEVSSTVTFEHGNYELWPSVPFADKPIASSDNYMAPYSGITFSKAFAGNNQLLVTGIKPVDDNNDGKVNMSAANMFVIYERSVNLNDTYKLKLKSFTLLTPNQYSYTPYHIWNVTAQVDDVKSGLYSRVSLRDGMIQSPSDATLTVGKNFPAAHISAEITAGSRDYKWVPENETHPVGSFLLAYNTKTVDAKLFGEYDPYITNNLRLVTEDIFKPEILNQGKIKINGGPSVYSHFDNHGLVIDKAGIKAEVTFSDGVAVFGLAGLSDPDPFGKHPSLQPAYMARVKIPVR